MTNEEWIALALDCGATKATVIPQEKIVTDRAFRDICQSNGCGTYGKCWMCPPDVGEIEPLMAQIREYSAGLWYQTVGSIEDSFDFEGMAVVAKTHVAVSQKIRAALENADEPLLHLSCGGCQLCERCAKLDNEPCRHPDKALASLESYGVDVYHTTADTDLRYINGPDTVTYFGIVLFGKK